MLLLCGLLKIGKGGEAMQGLAYAVKMEAALRQFLENNRLVWPAFLLPIIDDLTNLQSQLELILDKAASCADPARLPAVNFTALTGPQSVATFSNNVPDDDNTIAAAILVLWMLSGSLERMAQYYSQAAANSAHPTQQLFCRSLTEVKKISHRRVDGLLRVLYNRVWQRVGFAPYVLVK